MLSCWISQFLLGLFKKKMKQNYWGWGGGGHVPPPPRHPQLRGPWAVIPQYHLPVLSRKKGDINATENPGTLKHIKTDEVGVFRMIEYLQLLSSPAHMKTRTTSQQVRTKPMWVFSFLCFFLPLFSRLKYLYLQHPTLYNLKL